MSITITDVQYLDKFRPTETDVDWSLFNVGEPIDIQVDFTVEIYAISESHQYDDSNWIVLYPTPSKSGEAVNSDLILSDNPYAFENFYVGDTIQVVGTFKGLNDGSYTISEKIDDSKIRVTVPFSDASFVTTNGLIYVTTQFSGLKYYWNFIENKEGINFIDRTSGEENQYYYSTLDNSDSTQYPMVLSGNGTNEIGSVLVRGQGASTYGRKYRVNQTVSATPLFLAAQYANTLSRLSPSYYDTIANCLKHVFKIEVNRELSNPNDIQTVTYDTKDGNSGWFNENYNGQKQNYTTSNLVMTRVSDAASLDALELSTIVDATFTVTNTADAPFTDLSTQGMSLFWSLPDNETQYQNNGRSLEANFIYDYALATAGAGIVNGTNFGTTLQSIEETEITYVDADNITVRIRFDFGSLAQSIVNENDFKQYLFGFTIENHSLTRETSDKTTLLLSVDEFELQLFDVNLITNSTGFLFHRYSAYQDAVSTPDVFPVDDMVAYSKFNIDFNGLENDGIDILSVSHELILTHATNSDITVESNTYQTEGAIKLAGYNVPLISLEQNRAFTIADNDFRKLVTVKRDEAEDSGTVFAYETTYPFMVRWETWEALSVSNPPAGVYDSSLPNNGLNNFLYRYSTEGYTLNYRLRFTILQNGEQFNQEFDSPLTMHDFDSNTDWNNESIKSYDVASSTELVSGSDKFLQGYVDTRLEAAFTKTVGTLPALADVDIVFWVIGKEKGTIKSVKRASSYYSDSGETWFKGITSNELVDKTKIVSLYEGKVLVDFTKLSGSEFTVYSRIHDNVSGIPLDGKLLEDGTAKLLEDNTTKIIE